MAGVFISHAFADKAIVDPFVDDIIRLGCAVPAQQIFYSSGADTGVPSGKDLNAYVREQVAEASIVVAIISPTFQTRPVCVAELGASWSRVDNLFPIAVPGMPRTDLEGVLVGMLVKHLDDGEALDELHTRVTKAVGTTTTAQTWNQYRAKWLASVESYAAKLQMPTIITPDSFDRLTSELDGTRAALQASESDRHSLEDKLERVAAAKSAAEVADVLLPENEVERFEALREAASDAVGELPGIVGEALWYSIFEGEMPRPSYWDEKPRLEAAEDAKRDGWLRVTSSEGFEPDEGIKAVEDAFQAVGALRRMLDEESSADFGKWFHEKYGMTPDLSKRLVWNQLVAPQRAWR